MRTEVQVLAYLASFLLYTVEMGWGLVSQVPDIKIQEEGQGGISNLHIASHTPTGTLVKKFPHLSSLTLLPSEHSNKFTLISSGKQDSSHKNILQD